AWLWAIPLLPLLGFVINGLLSLVAAYHAGPADPSAAHGAAGPGESHDHPTTGPAHSAGHAVRHRYAAITSVVGPLVLVASFGLAVATFLAMRGIGVMEAPFIQTYFHWIPVGDLRIDAAFQLDQLSMVMTLVVTGVGMLIHVF